MGLFFRTTGTISQQLLLLFLFLLLPFIGWGQQNPSKALQKADSLRYAARYDPSNTYYLQAARQFEKEEAWDNKAEALYKISLNKIAQDNLKESSQHLVRAFSLSQFHFPSDTTFRIKYQYQKANIAAAHADYDIALTSYRRGQELANTSGIFVSWKIKLMTGIGEVYTKKGNYDRATHKLSQAEDLYQKKQLNDKKLLSRIYSSIGTVSQSMGNYKKALKYYNQSLEIDYTLLPRHHPELAKTYNNIAIIYYYQSDYDRALDHMKNAVEVLARFHGKNHRLIAAGYNNMGIVYSEIGKLKEALDYLKKALEIKQKVLGKEHPDIAIGYQNIGTIHYDMGKYDQAIAYYKRSESLHTKRFSDGHPELANVYANLGQAYAQKEAYKKALNYYQKDLEINLELLGGSHPFIGDTYTKIGETYSRIKNFGMALHYYERAIAIFVPNYSKENQFQKISIEQVAYPAKLLETLRLKAETSRKSAAQGNKQKRLDQSLQTYLQAIRLINKLQQSYSREDSKFLLRERTAGIYRNAFETAYLLYQQTGDSTYKEYAFYIASQSQNQILIEQLQKEAAVSFAHIPDSLINREKEMRSQLTSLQQELTGLVENPQESDSVKRFTLQDSLFHLRKNLESHIQSLEASYPKYYQLKYNPVVVRVAELQQEFLSPRQTIIRYFFGEESLFAIVITNNSFDIRKLPTDSLQQKVKSYRAAISETGSAQHFSEKSYELYLHLIQPIEDIIKGTQLLIIPDGILHYLPLESLVSQNPKESAPGNFYNISYLLEQYIISYLPSVNYLQLDRKLNSPDAKKQFLGFAPGFSDISTSEKEDRYPHIDRSLPALPLSKQEVKEIGSLMNERKGFWSFLKSNNHRADTFIGKRATEKAFKNLSLENYRYIHLATHAYVSEDNPDQSGILFAGSENNPESGTLYASEIYSLSLDAELIVLSACKTGIGQIAEGEGILSLSRAFQFAGAKNLLVSLWNVDDRATAQLMTTFYQQNSNTSSLPTALQKARINLIEKKQYAHPKYWVPFIFVGP